MNPGSRVTRSAARRQASSGPATDPAPQESAAPGVSDSATPASSTRNLRKRKPPTDTPSTDSPTTSAAPKKKKTKSNANTNPGSQAAKTSKRKSADIMSEQEPQKTETPSQTSGSKRRSSRSKKTENAGPPGRGSKSLNEDVEMKDPDERPGLPSDDEERDEEMADEDQDDDERYREEDYDEEDDDDVFEGSYLGGPGGPGGLSSTLRALSGLVSGISTKLRDILENLRRKEDPSQQLIALQELAELLLVSTEDNLSGHFSPDQFIKELVSLMQDQGPFGENPEMMLLACRCIANLMEALPAATANVVYGGAVPVLCAKLNEIQYIDLAEQSLSTLEKISVEYPTSIVREGGLTACLTYLDFFATNVQRTAVTTAANCCRNIPDDCFSTVKDVMPILLNVLQSSDQKVVEQGCQCVARIAESFRHHPDKLEQLLSKDMLKAILQLLLPGTTNIVGPHIHTQFLHVLGITAKASPSLSVELLKMNIVDTLYQILTGISPPSPEDGSMKNDTVMTMQALIHKPREQIYETLQVICELLPHAEETGDESDVLRRQLLKGCNDALKRFAAILLPTLTDAYTSTVNLNVRQKVLTAQLKMISNMETSILRDALSGVQFASHLATILSQKDHPSLVISALRAAELLIDRLPKIYRYHFCREGVVAEISKLASGGDLPRPSKPEPQEDDEDSEDDRSSPVSSRSSSPARNTAPDVDVDFMSHLAKKFIEKHEHDETAELKLKANGILNALQELADKLKVRKDSASFEQLASYFGNDSLESISSFELLNSGIVDALLKVLSDDADDDTRRAFLKVFMRDDGGETPFSVLVSKLQDLLSRSEHYEVVTVHQNHDGSRSSASMLAKQLRLKLITDEDSDIPKGYRNVMVSIHAIATFKALDDYLRPRICITERNKRRGTFHDALAAFAAAAGVGHGGFSGMLPSGSSAPPPAPAGAASSAPPPPKSKSGRRKSKTTAPPPKPAVPNPPVQHEQGSAQLECMDERQLPDDDDEMDDMDAVLDDIERDMEEDPEPDVGPVNMEVATSGKVTARREDGTRVATPVGSSARASAPSIGRMSYAAAAQPSVADWHIEFSINDQPITNDTTIYKAVQMSGDKSEQSYRNIWSGVHPIKFRKVPGPPPPDGPLSPAVEKLQPAGSLPTSLDKNKVSTGILQLLSILHALNANIDDVFGESDIGQPISPLPLSQFVNTKLTAKLNRQLEEPLIVASACLPSWSEDLARFYPFLFPFETRHLFLQSTSFGYSRSMARWQNSQQTGDSRHDRHRDENRPFLGRLQRQKVRISRERILESAIKVMDIYGASPSVLEVEYFEEVGTGLGPTLEFYSSVSRAFAHKKLKLWRENGSIDGEYAFGQHGLFPAPMNEVTANSETGKRVLNLFKILGKFVARSMLDSRIIDIFFNSTFFRTGDNADRAVRPSLGAVKSVDRDLAKSLKLLRKFVLAKKAIEENPVLTAHGKSERLKEVRVDDVRVEDLSLDFTLPGYPEIELVPGGSEIALTIHNVADYVNGVVDLTLGSGVRRQVEAFRTGFSQVFPYSALRSFTPDELVMLFGQVEEDWSLETLMDSMKADHGFNMDSKTVQNLLTAMSHYNLAERRDFLQFVTGSPKLPIGGFKSLTPLLTVVCKPSEPPFTSDQYLPSVMTCVNYLKLPDYSSLEVLKARLQVAMKEGQGAFHLS